MKIKTSQPGAVERELGARRVLDLIDEVQRRLTTIRQQAENQMETAKNTCNGAKNV